MKHLTTLLLTLLVSTKAYTLNVSEKISDLFCQPDGPMLYLSGIPTEIENGIGPRSVRIIEHSQKDSIKESTTFKVKVNEEEIQDASLEGVILKWKSSNPDYDDGFEREFSLDRISGELRESTIFKHIAVFKCTIKTALF